MDQSTQPDRATLAQLAARLFTARQVKARAAVRARQADRAAAERHLLPWLAMACLAGADLPELDEPLADLRTVDPDGIWTLSDAQARGLLAGQICPRARWAPVLGAARDAAVDRADAACRSDQVPESERAANIAEFHALRALIAALGSDPSGRHHVPGYRQTPATTDRKAA